MDDSILENGFREYLRDCEYSEWTSKDNPSTIPTYLGKIKKICNEQSISWESLAKNIENYVQSYDTNGEFAKEGKKEHGKVIAALKTYQRYIHSCTYPNMYPDEVEDKERYYPEGAKKTITVNAYERNKDARLKCIEKYGYQCGICGFKFADKYGNEFENVIHVHHLKPLSQIGENYKINPLKDLIPVCPNCHLILHSKKGQGKVYSPAEVKKMIAMTNHPIE